MQSNDYIFLRKGDDGNATKTERLSKNGIKKQLIDSLIESEKVETEKLNEKANKVEKREDASNVIKECEYIICTKKKNIICIAHQQGKVFKRFKEKENFISMVKKFKANKSIMIFKINIVKLIDKSPPLGVLEHFRLYIKLTCVKLFSIYIYIYIYIYILYTVYCPINALSLLNVPLQ